MAFHLSLPKTPLSIIPMLGVELGIHVNLGWELLRLFGLEVWFGRVFTRHVWNQQHTHSHAYARMCSYTQNYLFYKVCFLYFCLYKNLFQRLRKTRGSLGVDSLDPYQLFSWDCCHLSMSTQVTVSLNMFLSTWTGMIQ